MQINDESIDRAAACIWGEITDEFWSNATSEQQDRYRGIARAALTVAGCDCSPLNRGGQHHESCATVKVVHLPTVATPDGGQRATCLCDYDMVDPRCARLP